MCFHGVLLDMIKRLKKCIAEHGILNTLDFSCVCSYIQGKKKYIFRSDTMQSDSSKTTKGTAVFCAYPKNKHAFSALQKTQSGVLSYIHLKTNFYYRYCQIPYPTKPSLIIQRANVFSVCFLGNQERKNKYPRHEE